MDEALRATLKETSRLRDIDSLLHVLRPYTDSLPPGLLGSLANERSDASALARAAVGRTMGIETSDLRSADLSRKGLTRRLRKWSKRRGRDVSKLLGEVLGDESKVVELHALRKEVKKLKYLLELAEEEPPGLSVLIEWQERLGQIHDLDIAIAYLESVWTHVKSEKVLLQLLKVRRLAYAQFSRECRNRLHAAKGSASWLPVRPNT